MESAEKKDSEVELVLPQRSWGLPGWFSHTWLHLAALLSEGPSSAILPAAAAPCASAEIAGRVWAGSPLQTQRHPRAFPTLRATRTRTSSPFAVFTDGIFQVHSKPPVAWSLSIKPWGPISRLRCYPCKALQRSAQNQNIIKNQKLHLLLSITCQNFI